MNMGSFVLVLVFGLVALFVLLPTVESGGNLLFFLENTLFLSFCGYNRVT